MALRVLKGNPSKRRLPREPEFERPSECPSPPPFLDAAGVDEWWRVAPNLHLLGLLSTVDVMPLAAYCAAYARWAAAEDLLRSMEAKGELTHGLLIKGSDGTPRRNPVVKIASDSAADMLRISAEFGFTPAAKARVAAGFLGQHDGDGKFAGLLAGDPKK